MKRGANLPMKWGNPRLWVEPVKLVPGLEYFPAIAAYREKEDFSRETGKIWTAQKEDEKCQTTTR